MPSAVATRRACCAMCVLASPVAGTGRRLPADIDRTAHLHVQPAAAPSRCRRSTKFQAPMFSGSSWHQTTSALVIRRQHPAQRDFRERIDLLQPDRCAMSLISLRAPLRQQIVIDLAGADHDAAHLLGRRDRVDLRDDELEAAALGHLRQRRHRQLVPQQRFRRRTRSAACGNCAATAGAARGNSSPAWSGCTPTCCARRTVADSARCAPRSAPAPALRSRAAAAAPGRTCAATWSRRWR